MGPEQGEGSADPSQGPASTCPPGTAGCFFQESSASARCHDSPEGSGRVSGEPPSTGRGARSWAFRGGHPRVCSWGRWRPSPTPGEAGCTWSWRKEGEEVRLQELPGARSPGPAGITRAGGRREGAVSSEKGSGSLAGPSLCRETAGPSGPRTLSPGRCYRRGARKQAPTPCRNCQVGPAEAAVGRLTPLWALPRGVPGLRFTGEDRAQRR